MDTRRSAASQREKFVYCGPASDSSKALDKGVLSSHSGGTTEILTRGCATVLAELPTVEVPPWLAAASSPLGELPIKALLEGSVYYPACHVDGDPIKYLGGNFHSFIYADYGTGRSALCEELETFRGYRVFASRPVLDSELVPQGWSPRLPAGYVPRRSPPRGWIKPPFAEWIVYERLAAFPETHGPRRFSLLYVGGEGAASYQTLSRKPRDACGCCHHPARHGLWRQLDRLSETRRHPGLVRDGCRS